MAPPGRPIGVLGAVMTIAGATVTGASATDLPGTEAGSVGAVPEASTLGNVPAVNAVVADAPASPAMAAGAAPVPVTDTFLRWYNLLGTPPADAAEAHAAQEEAFGVFWNFRQAAGLLETGLMPALPTQAPGPSPQVLVAGIRESAIMSVIASSSLMLMSVTSSE